MTRKQKSVIDHFRYEATRLYGVEEQVIQEEIDEMEGYKIVYYAIQVARDPSVAYVTGKYWHLRIGPKGGVTLLNTKNDQKVKGFWKCLFSSKVRRNFTIYG